MPAWAAFTAPNELLPLFKVGSVPYVNNSENATGGARTSGPILVGQQPPHAGGIGHSCGLQVRRPCRDQGDVTSIVARLSWTSYDTSHVQALIGRSREALGRI